MSPLLLPLLLVTLHSESTATETEDSTGLKFIVAFPENIAYYHPTKPKNKVQITALDKKADITINRYRRSDTTKTVGAGQTEEIALDAEDELWREQISNKIVQISSTEKITVQAVSLKNNSVQTALVMPADKLGKAYFIPPVPRIEGTTDPVNKVTTTVIERSPFKLIIINTNEENNITVEGEVPSKVSLKPHQIAQIWVKEDEALRVVKADHPVAVLFGHTCAIRHNCTCGLLFTMLPPAKENKLKFYIPPDLAKDAEAETFVLLSEEGSTDGKLFSSDTTVVETAGTAVLYRPGLLLTLIPETDFAACYVVNGLPQTVTFAVIVVHKDFTDGIHVGNNPLQSPVWQSLKGTDYVSTSVALGNGMHVIWHAFSKMAVYFGGKMEGSLFGNPAPIISKSPDFRGCAVSPEVVKIGEVAAGWRESLKYCKDQGMELVSFPEALFQTHVYKKIQAMNDSPKKAWIGMRRSSQNGEWYWLNAAPVSDTNWAEGEPGTMQDGQCAIMSLESSKDFGWSDEDCCKAANPICYSKPTFFPI